MRSVLLEADVSRVLDAYRAAAPGADVGSVLELSSQAYALLRSGSWDADELCSVVREFGALGIPGDQFARWATRRQRGAFRNWWTTD